MINLSKIDLLKNQLRDLYNAEKVYIFGSYAWGTPTEESDLDVLVISEKYKELSYGRRISKATNILFNLDFSVDLIVETTLEFDNSKQINGSLESYVNNKGVLLHG